MSRFRSHDHARADRALALLRMLAALLVFVHGVARVWAGAVAPFGAFLEGAGVPMGLAVAWAVTVIEIAGAPLLVLGLRRLVAPVCLLLSAIYLCGIGLVHWSAGWFVVGLGRNGMEFSVLLIAVLLANAWRWWPEVAHRRKR
jgi:putative oxidoreductase